MRSVYLNASVLASAMLLAGCDMTHQLQVLSAGETGCTPAEIEISDDVPVFPNGRSWIAWCKSEPYQCSGAGNTVNCTATTEKEKPTTAAQKPKGPTWTAYEISGCGLVAEFQGEPKVTEQQAGGSSHSMTTTGFELPQGRGSMAVTCSDLPKKRSVPASAVLDGARDGMLRAVAGELVSEKEIIGGREVFFKVQGEYGLAHTYLVNDQIIAAIVVPVSAFGPIAAKHFVDSVELASPPEVAKVQAGKR